MLPTPSTSHVDINRVYEPAEDSFFLLDTVSSQTETAFLHERFAGNNKHNQSSSPVILEVGTGSGVVIAFLTTHAERIFGRRDVLSLGSDVNAFACSTTLETIRRAQIANCGSDSGLSLGCMRMDLATGTRSGTIDVLVFNPPYVPTEALPWLPSDGTKGSIDECCLRTHQSEFEDESHLLSLSYAGGQDGMEVTKRLLDQLPELLNVDRGVAYVLLCKQNKPDEVMSAIRSWGIGWLVEVIGHSGKTGGWEKLVVLRVWRH